MKSIKVQLIVILSIIILLASCANVSSPEDYDIVRRSIVLVKSSNAFIANVGTGWITEIEGQRVIITAKHIIEDDINYQPPEDTVVALLLERTLTVTAYDGQEEEVDILSYIEGDCSIDMSIDWCILSCPQALRELPFLEISKERALIGEEACWAGFPDICESAVVGSVILGDPYNVNLRRLDLNTFAGMSGSPLYVPDKGVVGMILYSFSGSHFGAALDMPLLLDTITEEYTKDMSIREVRL